ncbi:MAG TPA: dihydrofolate reductase family protein [Chitinophagaceae bacterium]|jgi:dihydrofolate reductase|nr:dihydrofolate reductase family protein [Chitinophagaceae bacterium]
MRKIVLFMHTTLDGFVAGPNGEMDWIYVDDEMFDYAGKETDQADTALYGRVTYEMMESYWPTAADQPNATKHDIQHSHWYNSVTKVVLSRTMKGQNLKNTMIIGDNVPEQIHKLKQQGDKNILIFGSPTAVHSLLKENMIDEFWIFINPVLLGEGIPLFADVKDKLSLKLLSSKVFSSGVVGLQYERN